MFYVYIIRSRLDSSYYKGVSEHPGLRLDQHNSGLSKYTSGKLPWDLVYVELMPSKREALIRERSLKKYSHSQIEYLIRSPKNIFGKQDLG